MTQFVDVVPVLPVRDISGAIHYYTEKLGFGLVFQDDPQEPCYAVLKRDGAALHVQWHEETDFKGVEAGTLMLRFSVDDPDALFEEYRDKGVFHDRTQLRDTPWGTREFAFFDPDGNGLTFYRGL